MTHTCMNPEGCDQPATLFFRGTVILENEQATMPAPVQAITCSEHAETVQSRMCLAEGYPYTVGTIPKERG